MIQIFQESNFVSKVQKLSAVKGMNDILPASVPRTEKLPTSARWQ